MSETGFPTHKYCANFKNGFCMAYRIAVNPDEPACPNFTPKTTEPTQTILRTPFAPYSQAVPPPPQITANLSQLPPRSWRRNRYRIAGRGGRGRMGGGGRGGGGRGRMGGFTAGPGGFCTCLNCGYTVPHIVGTPCYQQVCPRCRSRMTRKI